VDGLRSAEQKTGAAKIGPLDVAGIAEECAWHATLPGLSTADAKYRSPMSSRPRRKWHPAGAGYAQGECHGHADGKKGLIIGIANEHSLAYGCARHFRAAGAELAITYLNTKSEPYVRPLAAALQSDIFMPCDVTVPGQLEAVYERVTKDWGRLDFVQHSIAYARKEDLQGRITDCSVEGFTLAMQVSVQSFLRMAKLSER